MNSIFKWLLVLLWVAALADLSLTIWADIRTPFAELNPIARNLLSRNQLYPLVGFKLGMTAVGTAIFWRCRRRAFTQAALVVVLLIFAALLVRWWIFVRSFVGHPF